MATVSAPQAEVHPKAHPSLALPTHALKLWHLTSLDAPTVAVTWTLAFAWAAEIHLPLWLPATLALSAWTFYVADRLMDARASRNPSSLIPGPCLLRPRHHHHWQHRRIFLPLAILAALAAIALVLHYMPLPARERNSLLAAATLFYFATVHTPAKAALKPFLKLPKELLVGILFTLACTLPVLTRIPAELRPAQAPALAIATVVFIALAWLNCHAIESWESKAEQGSIATFALALAAIGLSAAIATIHHSRISLLLLAAAASALLLLCLDRTRPSLHPTTLRAAADLALLTPLLLLGLSFLPHN